MISHAARLDLVVYKPLPELPHIRHRSLVLKTRRIPSVASKWVAGSTGWENTKPSVGRRIDL